MEFFLTDYHWAGSVDVMKLYIDHEGLFYRAAWLKIESDVRALASGRLPIP